MKLNLNDQLHPRSHRSAMIIFQISNMHLRPVELILFIAFLINRKGHKGSSQRRTKGFISG
jgi:hypothetical protein